VFAVRRDPPDRCVNIGVTQIFKGMPDLVVSGSQGLESRANDVTYSAGGGPRSEAALRECPAIAVSLRQSRGEYDFVHAAHAAAVMADAICRRRAGPHIRSTSNVPKDSRRAIA